MQAVRVLCVSWLLLALVGTARADAPPVPAVPAAEPSPYLVAIATNLPVRWDESASVGVSLYVGLLAHHAIRANLATYKSHTTIREVIGEMMGGDGVDHAGRITDLGIGWVYYPRRTMEGFTLEIGALRRARNVTVYDPDAVLAYVDHDTTVYAGRVMLGWSWRYKLLFTAVAVGASVGHESGVEIGHSDLEGTMSRKRIDRGDVTGEAYFRAGFVFGR